MYRGTPVPLTPEMKSPRAGLGYNVVAFLYTSDYASPRKVLFVAKGLKNDQPFVSSVTKTTNLVVLDEPKIQNVVAYTITNDVQDCSTSVSQPKTEPAPYVQP